MSRMFEITDGPFEPTRESLQNYECPKWFKDAKFGIWSHWGPQSVPMYGDWYARNMYIEGTDQYYYHWRRYGHPSEFGYKDIVKLWKAERFDPEGLMKLFVEAGAKYFVAQAVHHDNFDNWDSKHNPWNSVKVGPRKNIVRLWQEEAEKLGLPFGLSEHLAATYSWFSYNKGADKTGPFAGVAYDGNDPRYEDLYLPNRDEFEKEKKPWYTDNPWWHQKWFDRMKDLIDQHHPDLLYSDGHLPFGEIGLHVVAHLYNTNAKVHGGTGRAVYTQKHLNEQEFKVGILDIERGGQTDISPDPWQTDTSIGDWFYNVRDRYKSASEIIETLIDIVSKNGNLLLNVPQKPDGTLDDECTYILKEISKWIRVNGDGIYATRPWRVYGEGPTVGKSGSFSESALGWTSEDYRFTSKGRTIYAFQMRWPDNGKSLIRSLSTDQAPRIRRARLLGSDMELRFEQGNYGLYLELPNEKLSDFPHCFELTTD